MDVAVVFVFLFPSQAISWVLLLLMMVRVIISPSAGFTPGTTTSPGYVIPSWKSSASNIVCNSTR
jgi:hypothetical protein